MAPATPSRAADLAVAAERLGSAREARWILDRAGDDWPALVERRAAGEPLQYVLGTWPFRGFELRVDRRVLIPRPETEQVVEVALRELARLGTDGARRDGVCVDLGTGSGAIALSLAGEGPRCFGGPLEVWATDLSADALEVAAGNLAAQSENRSPAPVHLARGSWFEALPVSLAGRVDLLVSNPPYVPEEEIGDLDPVVRDWEPHAALASPPGTGGVPGMADIETIVRTAPGWLAPGGVLVVELGPSQAAAAKDLAGAAGFARRSVEPDLAGRSRVLVAGR